MGRCETCQAKIGKINNYIEGLKRQSERSKQERLNSEKKRKRTEKQPGEDKGQKKEYNQIEIDCEFGECKVKKYR